MHDYTFTSRSKLVICLLCIIYKTRIWVDVKCWWAFETISTIFLIFWKDLFELAKFSLSSNFQNEMGYHNAPNFQYLLVFITKMKSHIVRAKFGANYNCLSPIYLFWMNPERKFGLMLYELLKLYWQLFSKNLYLKIYSYLPIFIDSVSI